MEKNLHILLVEASIEDIKLIEHLLKKEGFIFSSRAVETKENYQEQLKEFEPDVVISSQELPHFHSREALEIFRDYKKNFKETASFILVTGTVSEEFAVEAIRSGADDYILKDRLKRLPFAVSNAVEKNRLNHQKQKTDEEKHYLLDMLQKSLHEIYVFHPETLQFEYANKEALQNLGYTMEEMYNMTPADMIKDFDVNRYKRMLNSVENSAKGKIYERTAIRKDNTTYPVQIHMQVIQQGNKRKILANLLDITEAKENQQQKELAFFIQNCFQEDRSLEASLEVILKEFCTRSAVSAGEVWASDFEGEPIKCYASWDKNGQCIGMRGEFFAEAAKKAAEPIFFKLQEEDKFPNGKPIPQTRFKAAMACPMKLGDEITAVIVLYDCRIIENRNPFINLKEGVQDKLAGNIKRKKTEEELQKIFELSPDILTIIGKDGFVRKINPALQNLLGYSNEEMLKMSYDTLIHPDDVHILEDWRNLVLEENEVAYYESRWLAKDGNYRCFSWSITPFLKDELHFAVGRDVTLHKSQLKAIRSQNEKLADIAWEQSHIVRAPLTRIMACIAYLEEKEENPRTILNSIKESAYELDKILKTIVAKTQAVTHHEEY